jgi:hypothetical protein
MAGLMGAFFAAKAQTVLRANKFCGWVLDPTANKKRKPQLPFSF